MSVSLLLFRVSHVAARQGCLRHLSIIFRGERDRGCVGSRVFYILHALQIVDRRRSCMKTGLDSGAPCSHPNRRELGNMLGLSSLAAVHVRCLRR